MWPFPKTKKLEYTPWDALAGYLLSNHVEFDFTVTNLGTYHIIYKGKTLILSRHSHFSPDGLGSTYFNLRFNDTNLVPYLQRYMSRIKKHIPRLYKIKYNTMIEKQVYCDLFEKCDE